MAATIRIVIDRRDDVLRAPNRALRYSLGGRKSPKWRWRSTLPDGWSQLWILRDRKPTAIAVQLGLDDGVDTEIVEGYVQPGDELIIGEGGGVLEKPSVMRPPNPELRKPKT